MKIKAEYIWIDGKTPTAKLRSKTKIMDQGTEPPIWGFDGSSTEQATGDQSEISSFAFLILLFFFESSS